MPCPSTKPLAAYFLSRLLAIQFLEPNRPKIIKWYCPFAHQAVFPSGHRYCVNVFAGPCPHGCLYCYTNQYQRGETRRKADFCRLIDTDIQSLEEFGVPPAPVHLSNSTDPFQPIERECGHTRLCLGADPRPPASFHDRNDPHQRIPCFQPSMAILTSCGNLQRCPAIIPDTLSLRRRGCRAFKSQVSLAFWQDHSRATYDPAAPTVAERIEGVRAYTKHVFPSSYASIPFFRGPRFRLFNPSPCRTSAWPRRKHWLTSAICLLSPGRSTSVTLYIRH